MKVLLLGNPTSSLRDLLGGIGCPEIRATTDSAEALRLARELSFDLAVVDLDTVGASAAAGFCNALASLATTPIVTTGNCDEAIVELVIDAGAHDHIAKPIRAREFRARLRGALRLRSERLRHEERAQTLTTWARQLDASRRQLQSAASIDALTGVANRGHFDQVLEREWGRALRSGSSLSIVIVDLDHFHAYNERHGHVGGDTCLRRVAAALAHVLRRPSDVLARYGGEEFVAILPDTDLRGACVVAERLRLAIEELHLPHEGAPGRPFVTMSAGVATRSPVESMPPETLIVAADHALFRAKRDGRNRCVADGQDTSSVRVVKKPWPAGPKVIADPSLSHRIPKFLESRRTDVRWARTAAHAGDFGRIRMMCSNLTELAVSLGFIELAELSAKLEVAAQRNARADVLPLVEQLAAYLDAVHVVYQRPVLRAV